MAWVKDGSPVLSQGFFGHFPEEVELFIDDVLAKQNPNLNRGVQALFNADLQVQLDNADRDEWVVISPYQIVLASEIMDPASDKDGQ